MKPIAMKNFVRRSPVPALRAFTLIELLVVISIIGVLAAFTVAGVSVVTRKKYINAAQSEMGAIQAALERYKSAYGFYPPSNPNNLLVNPLYFELQGVTSTTVGTTTTFTTLDGMNSISAPLGNLGVSGFVNCSHGAGEDAVLARNLLPGLKANQWGVYTNPTTTVGSAILVTAVGGPDPSYKPLGVPNLNPWRYNSVNPTNSPGTYDLYIQLVIGGKTNLISNWSKTVLINNSTWQ
jgi:prepilin-type N-terminal cleavage/methylation domain-containing protein